MFREKISKWAELLLDTGKRNSLVSFKDTKSSTVEIVYPDVDTFFSKIDSTPFFEVYDAKITSEDEEELYILNPNYTPKDKLDRGSFIEAFSKKLKKANQILAFNSNVSSQIAIKNISKKSRSAIEETGVNVAFASFGFIKWRERDSSKEAHKAPILLAPISISRESSIDPYHIKVMGDEVIVNPTFSFKLYSEYGIKLADYEDDESLDSYISKIEAQITSLGWEIIKECKIGIFSFQKINMYHDLKDNADKILENENVIRLMKQLSGIEEEVEFKPFDLSNELIQLHNVVDADSSQIDAIEMAKSGQSFVLQGPPGTGKSQTITNVIAELLNDGKKVLFVSEKLAALNVVYDKLKNAGLSDFCLELHSHKANKKTVITELSRVLKLPAKAVSKKAEYEIGEKAKHQEALDSYVKELHKTNDVIGKSLYQLYGLFFSINDDVFCDYLTPSFSSLSYEQIEHHLSLLRRYKELIPIIGKDYTTCPWYGFESEDTSYSALINAKIALRDSLSAFTELKKVSASLYENYGIQIDSLNDFKPWVELIRYIAESKAITPELCDPSVYSVAYDKLSEMKSLSIEICDLSFTLNKDCNFSVYSLSGKDLYEQLRSKYRLWIVRLFSREYKALRDSFPMGTFSDKKLSYKSFVYYTNILNNYQSKLERFEKLSSEVKELLSPEYEEKFSSSDIHKLLLDLDALKSYMSSVDDAKKISKCSHIKTCEYATALNSSVNTILTGSPNFLDKFSVSIFDPYNSLVDDVISRLTLYTESADILNSWFTFLVLSRELKENLLLDYIKFALSKEFSMTELDVIYEKSFLSHWINILSFDSPIISEFSRAKHDDEVKLFCEKDLLQFEISKAQIRSTLSEKRPALDVIVSGSPVSILLREAEKKRKQKSIRSLLFEIGDLVQILKPCFLMSPLSVSTFLSTTNVSFDTVVFDEASQIFPQDAIGSIYRGKQLIVVGDSKQMPPSNFFNSSIESDDEDVEDVSDFESILDVCSFAFPQLRLKWHYRSRYEQLIAFSNKSFYDNSLVTFPSPVTDKKWIGIDYHFADGVFDRSTRTNFIEAERVVDLIYENIERFPERSLGVVAFSISQQDLIDRLLSKRRARQPEKEFFFRADRPEPFFIKNLETVQGDERDTIIFSTAYAKDSVGKFSHNFGPLNRAGGERRLNVAVTRAKVNVQLVTSIHSADISLERTKSTGARLLKEYIAYAETGVLDKKEESYYDDFLESSALFEEEVCEALSEFYARYDTKLGESSFKIDIAVRHQQSNDYALAIECDGDTYNSSSNARDRDRLRKAVLERMGWKHYRIWSTEWQKNKQAEKERLLEAVKNAYKDFKPAEVDYSPEASADDFTEDAEITSLDFPEYEVVDIDALSPEYDNKLELISRVLEKESPLSESWLLKRMLKIMSKKSANPSAVATFEAILSDCSAFGIYRHNGFLYSEYAEPQFRASKDNLREIKQISLDELAFGMLKIIEHTLTINKDGLFRTVASLLGFARISPTIIERLDLALEQINDMIKIDKDTISIKK